MTSTGSTPIAHWTRLAAGLYEAVVLRDDLGQSLCLVVERGAEYGDGTRGKWRWYWEAYAAKDVDARPSVDVPDGDGTDFVYPRKADAQEWALDFARKYRGRS